MVGADFLVFLSIYVRIVFERDLWYSGGPMFWYISCSHRYWILVVYYWVECCSGLTGSAFHVVNVLVKFQVTIYILYKLLGI